jgi:4-amino-4-deoxy-L-arabinose transferase-like glycosyltransferase
MRRTSQIAVGVSIVIIGVRLIAINQPFIGPWSWRQNDVAAIARNYFDGGFHFTRPQIDWAGDQPGYVGTEFPVLPFAAALCYKIVGVHEWVGRVQGVIFFAVSLPFFYLLAREILGRAGSIWALIFYGLTPLGIMASRCFMPDGPSLSLSIIGLYFFVCWMRSESNHSAGWTPFILGALTISFSILIKLPSAIIGAPLAGIAFQHFRFSAFRVFRLWVFAAIALLPAAIWYWHAYQISLNFYPHHFFGAGGVKIMPLAWYWKIAKEVPMVELTPIGFALFGIGVLAAWSNEQQRRRAQPLYWWLAAMVLFVIVVGYGNRHPWYRLPLIPIAAIFAGAACEFVATRMPRHAVRAIGSIILVASLAFFSFISLRDLYEPATAALWQAGLTIKEITPDNALIAAADNGDPTAFYYGERKGWHFLQKGGIYDGDPADSESAISNLRELREKGANYLVFSSNTMWWLDLYPEFRDYVHANSALIAATSQFQIYRLDPISK